MIGIYKITNKINGKIYVGQSIDIDRRWKEHRWDCVNPNVTDYNSKKNRALRKYGVDNFIFEVLEETDEEDLNQREIFWITTLDTVNNGYNLSNGGHGPNLTGENHSQAKNSQTRINELQNLLAETEISYTELMEKFGLSRAQISNINRGKNWVRSDLDYPLRKSFPTKKGEQRSSALFTDQEVLNIRTEYKTMSATQLTEKYKDRASSSTIKKIVGGESYTHLPIYKKSLNKWI